MSNIRIIQNESAILKDILAISECGEYPWVGILIHILLIWKSLFQ